MALAAGMPSTAARNPSPTGINLSSNNPFRNRTSPLPSPSLEAPAAASDNRNNRMSRNPFLDSNALASSTNSNGRSARENDTVNGLTADIFGDMSLLDKAPTNGPPPPSSRPPRSGTMPAPQTLPPSQASPVRRDLKPELRPSHHRRNSESSVMDKERSSRRERDRSERPPRTESEERRRRERRKEREERHRREKERVRNGGRPLRGLDIIDKLDVTGVYGQGVFHHDGPFDACNPHRNVRKDKRAPMRAFPADSANMALGGKGPVKAGIDLDRFHGRGEEGFSDYASAAASASRKAEMNTFNPTDRVEQVHGRETSGLGTSTFLDGAPASRSALQRTTSEDQTASTQENFSASVGGSGGNGLQRKKSLAQRLRGMSSGRRERPTDLRGPDGNRYMISSNNTNVANTSAVLDSPPPLTQTSKSISAGGPVRTARYTTRDNEPNPFDTEYTDAFDKKGAQIQIIPAAEPETSAGGSSSSSALRSSSANVGRARAPSSPSSKLRGDNGSALMRSRTEEPPASPGLRVPEDYEQGQQLPKQQGGGLLSRMKSLRGGRRQRPERRESDY